MNSPISSSKEQPDGSKIVRYGEKVIEGIVKHIILDFQKDKWLFISNGGGG